MKSGHIPNNQHVNNAAAKAIDGTPNLRAARQILRSVNGNGQATPKSTKALPIPTPFRSAKIHIAPSSSRIGTPPKKPRIPATDPKKISILWQKVMEPKYIQPTRASQAKAKSSPKQSKQTEPSEAIYSSSSKTSNSPSTRSARIKLDNAAFREVILLPRRISIDNERLSRSAFQHFQTSPLERYQDVPGLASTTVWLEGDGRFKTHIADRYKEMKDWTLCEAEYAQYVLEHLLKSEVRDPDAAPSREWKTKRMIQLVAKPEGLWKSPPIIDTLPTNTYNFDIRPDASYWIPIEVFNDRYRHLVRELTYAKYNKIVCPYLSIEFKKGDTEEGKAETQVAVAASIALYNRFLLKEKRLRKNRKTWTDKHIDNIRHYGITFIAEAFTVWCVRPKKPLDISDANLESWTGCVMESVHKNMCDTLVGVQNLMEWINEIHRWGLTVHGDSCQRDIQHCIEADDIARTSLGESQKFQDSDTDPEPDLPR